MQKNRCALSLAAIVFGAALLLPLPAQAHVPDLADPAPAEAFCIVVIQPLDGFRLVRVTVDEDLKPVLRNASWSAADQNRDGVLSPQEQEAFQLASLQFWAGGNGMGNRSMVLEPGAPYTRFGTVRPVYATTWRHVGHGYYEDPVSGHTGVVRGDPVTATQFETQAVREYGFHVASPIAYVTLRGGGNMTADGIDSNSTPLPRPVVETVVVKAPQGWRVRHVEGYGYGGARFQRDANNESVEIRGFDTSAPWAVRFVDPVQEKELGKIDGAPAPGFLVLALGLLALVGFMRRRQIF